MEGLLLSAHTVCWALAPMIIYSIFVTRMIMWIYLVSVMQSSMPTRLLLMLLPFHGCTHHSWILKTNISMKTHKIENFQVILHPIMYFHNPEVPCRSWGYISRGRVLIMKAWRPEFNSQHRRKRQGMKVCSWNSCGGGSRDRIPGDH